MSAVGMAIVEITATDVPRVLRTLAGMPDVFTVTRMDTNQPTIIVAEHQAPVTLHGSHVLTPDLRTPDCTPECWQ